MSADASNTMPRTAFLKHLDRVYEMARVLAPTDKQASKLVEATYRRAAQCSPPSSHEVRAWLFRLLLQTYATRRSDAATTSSVSTMRRPADLLQDFRFQTAEDALQRAVPAAFALQPPREQLVLTLCDIVELSTEEAAVVLDTEPDALTDEVASAREALWEAIYAELTDGEQTLIEEELPDDALLEALRRVIAPHLGPLPPTLRPSVTAIVEQTPPEDEDDEPSPTSEAPLFTSSRADPSPDANPEARRTGSSRAKHVQRLGVILLVLLVTGLTGYFLSSSFFSRSEPVPTDLLQLSVQYADNVQAGLQTGNADEAEQYVYEQLGRRITVPAIESATLDGVSIVEVDADTHVPALLFDDADSGQRITTYAYTYALLDQLDNRVQLGREIRQQLQEEERIHLQTRSENGVLIWRKQADIYVAVTKADPREVRPRITP